MSDPRLREFVLDVARVFVRGDEAGRQLEYRGPEPCECRNAAAAYDALSTVLRKWARQGLHLADLPDHLRPSAVVALATSRDTLALMGRWTPRAGSALDTLKVALARLVEEMASGLEATEKKGE